jgi:uncharacterized protein (TIGR03546 family)
MFRNSFWKRSYLRFIKIHGEPRTIALGFALGLFIGMSPFLGLHIITALFLATILKWNKLSALIGVWISNPFTAPVIYGLTYLTGAKILSFIWREDLNTSQNFDFSSLASFFDKAPEIIWALILGGVVVGILVAIIGYFISYYAIVKYRRDIKIRIAQRRERRAKRKLEKKKEKQKNIVRM